MSEHIIARCGYRCDLCLAFRKNVEKNDQRQMLSDGWFKYFGFRIEPKDIVCDGCMSGENPKLIDDGCPVRPCVLEKEIENCGHCDECACDKLKTRIVDGKELAEKLKVDISEEDHKNFIEPYESKPRLDRIHKGE